jgi:type IV pilus assembly protein PilB
MALPDDQLKDLVLNAKLVDESTLSEIERFAVNSELPLDRALLQKGLISEEKLAQLNAEFYKVPYINLSKIAIPPEVYNLIPERFARKQKIIPFERNAEGIKVAMSNPDQTELLTSLAKKTGSKIFVYFSLPADISNALRSYEKDLQKTVDDLLKEDIWSTTSIMEDPPVAKIVDLLIDTAYQERASDIHIEPQENSTLSRFRIDGMLRDVMEAPKYLHDRIITRLKVLSNLRTDEHLSAQDGKMRMELEEENLDIRVSIIPVVQGEKAVLRLLSSRSRQYNFQTLGMNETDLKKVEEAYSKSYGMILSTGPTGSGKTTSIYSILKVLNTREKNITTVEDPVEYRIKGANQIQVNVKANLTFANGLRSILRQDPNIIFVGEIRDNETAGIAVNAALTGHLVLSTLHTNDAATAIPRLSDMGVEPFLVASTVNIIIAQRLVRQICSQCRNKISLTHSELAKNFSPEVIKSIFGTGKDFEAYQGQGCKACRNTGYLGRVGLFEVLEVTKNVRRLITEKADADVIARAAVQEGMATMLEDGLIKVKQGITTIEEVLRVAKSEFIS